MKPADRLDLVLATCLLVAASPSTLTAQVADPDPLRFAEAFEEFASWDAKNTVPSEAILFVGSSSIVRWGSAEAFPDLPVVNRGFGGSQASDVVHWVEEAVLAYDPAVVVYYAGDNDVSAGKKARQIFDDMHTFAEAVLASDSDTQVVFISVKPSLSRWEHWSEMQATNDLLRQYTLQSPRLHFVDVGTPMLGPDGQPIPELFVSDGLHMTPAGYEIWNRVVGPVVRRLHGG
jgi:lysophospholipase L1-like esterase